jgi:streptomycin 6-kinase
MWNHMTPDDLFARWQLAPDGEPITTPTSTLYPVRRDGLPAMLKVAREEEERRGAATMVWWSGEGAAPVLAHDGAALLMARATGTESLADMARYGSDDEATRIICHVATRLHAATPTSAPPALVPLAHWFAALEPAAATHGGLLAQAATTARALLADQSEIVVLHGDLHHENVLDFGALGWLAIDPKGLLGERTFDFVNLLRNPYAELATSPERFRRQATVIAEAAGLDRTRLLRWTLAFAGLSAAWIIGNGDEPVLDLAIAELAASELRWRG